MLNGKAVSLNKNFPDFFVIGAAKSGTTSLYSYLAQHPDLYLPDVKEPNYYAYKDSPLRVIGPKPDDVLVKLLLKKTVTTESDYHALFAGATTGQLTGDCSPRYLYYKQAPERIYHDFP